MNPTARTQRLDASARSDRVAYAATLRR